MVWILIIDYTFVMSLTKDFGKRIKELREALFMSQETFAEKIGIHRNSLVRIETGEGFASLQTLEKIHDVLQIPYSELFKFDEQPKKDSSKAFLYKLNDLNEADTEYFLTNINAYIKAKNKNNLK